MALTVRRAPLLLAALVVALALVGTGWWVLASGGPDQSEMGSDPLQVTGVRSELVDREQPTGDGRIAWWTSWKVCWDPVPGAESYEVTILGIEGPGIPQTVPGPCHELTVANGTTGRSGEYPGRDQQLALVSASMSVSVAARFPDGTIGPPSADVTIEG